ncbi:outer membrane protein assembly factor BamA [Gilvibacter sediminis]|uniref:outer membrane protein assembly factor BamA n=1 Tax=Gilvibacter sediminis TaxID=379071 RepID=UPI0023502A14|nr:outer membrane protein assembly factor BamA [Gilvibacter sediminis]MDC7998763.1 outer membrane protein assembly factor BamA [Gilvibacter sediminis]
MFLNSYKRTLPLLLLFFLLSFSSFGQKRDLDANRKYEIGNIEITGLKSYNAQTVLTFTGLKTGERIYVPGQRLSDIITNLWDQNLFSDISIYVTRMEGDVVDLEINIQELPTLNNVSISGIRDRKARDIINDNELKKGQKVTQNLLTTTKNYILNKYREQGFLNAQVIMSTTNVMDSITGLETKQDLAIAIDKGERVKVDEITFSGNEALTDAKLQKAMKNTKKRFPLRFWKRSKYIEDDYEADKESILDKYKENGYRDARIVSDTLIRKDDNTVALELTVEEGNQYYFGDIDFIGNSVFSDELLSRVLGIQKGDTYNGVLLEERIADVGDPEALDLTNQYQNNGYLFSRINPVEVNVRNDTIDFEIRIIEGKPAYFDHVTVVGNTRTNDHVVYRELRTRPGEIYSKSNVVRTVRELGQVGYFDPEQISPNFKNVDPNSGTLDMEYSVVEKGSSQIELQGGYGGGGFVGTVGLSFNNFSIRNIFNGKAYKPLPMGDGQTLSLRAQASTFFQTYSLSFIEPWLGGRKPIQFSASFSHTVQFFFDFRSRDADRSRKFLITGGSLGIAKRLKWPDDFFQISHAVSFQHFDLKNYITNLFTFGDGFSNNLAYTIGLSRDNTTVNPIYPLGGSQFALTAKLTPPWSLFSSTDFANLENDPEFQDINGNPDQARIDQERFKWLEFYKIKFNATWYTRVVDKLVLRTHAEFGFLGAYNNDRGIPPFERFFVGGDGLGAFSLDGREVVQLRGYPNQSLSTIDGNTIFNKFTLELRYPISLKQLATIYALTFIEGGAAWDSFRDYNPFVINRSAGAGIRIFMPAFGLLGIDFGYGFDPIPGGIEPNGWETHFIIGQRF